MRIETRYVGPGLFLILLGVIPLAVREGLLEPAQLAGIWRLWPLFLVAAGLGVLLRTTRLHDLGGILAAGLGGLMVGTLLAGALVGGSGGWFDGFGPLGCMPVDGEAFPARTGTLRSAGSAVVDVTVECGDATVATGPGDGWSVVGRSADGAAPRVEAGAGGLSIRGPVGSDDPFGGVRWAHLDVVAPAVVDAYVLTVKAGSLSATAGDGLGRVTATVDAGSLLVDLAAAGGLTSVSATVNAGAASFVLPDASIHGSLTVNAGSIALCVPSGVGLRLRTPGFSAGAYDYEARGLTEENGVWTSPGWATAVHLIDLSTTANAGAITLDPEEGCR